MAKKIEPTSDLNKSILEKLLSVSEKVLGAEISRVSDTLTKARAEGDTFSVDVGKAVTKDWFHFAGSQGYYDRPYGLSFELFRDMARKSTVVAAIITARKNSVAAFSHPSIEGSDRGFRIVPKDRTKKIRDLAKKMQSSTKEADPSVDTGSSDSSDVEDEEEISQELLRKAEKKYDAQVSDRVAYLTKFVAMCGEEKDRPFYMARWNFDAFLRAVVADSLTFDQIAVEIVPKEASTSSQGNVNAHHFYPIDGSTIRLASPELKKVAKRSADIAQQSPDSYLYEEATAKQDPLKVDPKVLDDNGYRYVQVVRGRIVEIFTEDELAFGIRNTVTDINLNGYPLCELEILIGLVTAHLNTEQYRKSYYQQGFSAKGILHVKADLNRAKLEELRRQWNHMLKGSRNFFQTPIMAGVQGIDWIKLDQSDGNIEYATWLNYLVRMISAIYQIAPEEWGYNLKDEGGGGSGGLSGDNTTEKLQNSRDRGFVPLMIFLQGFMNHQIIEKIDPEYEFQWVGLTDESPSATLARQQTEVKFKKTVNEIRKESGLPPLPDCDNLILDTNYIQWMNAKQMAAQPGGGMPGAPGQEDDQDPALRDQEPDPFEDVVPMPEGQNQTDQKDQPVQKSQRLKRRRKATTIEIIRVE